MPYARKETSDRIQSFEKLIEEGYAYVDKTAYITYTSAEEPFEHYFQSIIYLIFTLLGQYAICEMHTFTGRIDCIVATDRFLYLFEFKRDETAEKALQQINDKSYTLPFKADSRKLYKIGVTFDSEKRILSDWKVEEA